MIKIFFETYTNGVQDSIEVDKEQLKDVIDCSLIGDTVSPQHPVVSEIQKYIGSNLAKIYWFNRENA